MEKVVNFITICNWCLLVVAGVIVTMAAPVYVASGVIIGGLIVAVNFHLLKSTLKKMFHPEVVLEKGRAVVGNVLIKYYIRFAVSAGIIFVLISKHIVHPLGLLAGLSVVVASMFLATGVELMRLLFKEAV